MQQERRLQVIIIGGGASGLVAAIAARRGGAEVTLLERNTRIGKKLLATGNGRCNFTNLYTEARHYHGTNPKFVYSALSQFGVAETTAFFRQLGIDHKVEDCGKVFPRSDQASSVLDVLRYELEELGVDVRCEARVQEIGRDAGVFRLHLTDGSTVNGDRVILAAGGKAMPASGSDGSGFELARQIGHTVVDPFPALVQLKLEGDFFKQVEGLKFAGTAEILREQDEGDFKMVARDRGEILFTSYGVSGPPILQISRKAGELLQMGGRPWLRLVVLDTMSPEEIVRLLSERFQNMPKKTLEISLVGLISKRLIPVLLRAAGVADLRCRVANLPGGEREKIAGILTDWKLPVRGTMSWQNAQVTAGGVSTAEVDPRTLQSRLAPGLYLCGEVLDIDGACGGYNLQWAWSSGYIAGSNAAAGEA
jgi:predicted Rossmann fold flavoprotein